MPSSPQASADRGESRTFSRATSTAATTAASTLVRLTSGGSGTRSRCQNHQAAIRTRRQGDKETRRIRHRRERRGVSLRPFVIGATPCFLVSLSPCLVSPLPCAAPPPGPLRSRERPPPCRQAKAP